MKKATTLLYYSGKNLLPKDFADAVRQNLRRVSGGRRIIWQMQKEDVLPSYTAILLNICEGLEKVKTEYVAFCEHDVLYTATHFDRIPVCNIEYNKNRYRLLANKAVYCKRLGVAMSTLIGKTDVTLNHFQERLAYRDTYPPKGHWEPKGDEHRVFGLTKISVGFWKSQNPNVDVVNHGYNLTRIKNVRNPQKSLRSWGLATDVIKEHSIPTIL